MTYLELCQDLVGQFGLSGGTGPTTVAGQVGELANVTRWIRDASIYIDNLWEDWNYLWTEYAEELAADDYIAPSPTVEARTWNLKTIKYRATGSSDQYQPLPYLAWDAFTEQFDPATDDAGEPSYFTIAPNGSLRTNCKADVAYDIKGEYWRAPVLLADDDDEPLIPASYHRLIIAKAVIAYGDREDAPELINGATAEYVDLLEKLEANQLPGSRHRRQSMDHGAQASGEE